MTLLVSRLSLPCVTRHVAVVLSAEAACSQRKCEGSTRTLFFFRSSDQSSSKTCRKVSRHALRAPATFRAYRHDQLIMPHAALEVALALATFINEATTHRLVSI